MHLLPHPPQYGPQMALALIACYLETSLPPIPWKLRISIRKCKGKGDIIVGTGEKRVIKKEREKKGSKKNNKSRYFFGDKSIYWRNRSHYRGLQKGESCRKNWVN
jgi:hypothetical protein